jgi:hypothetical protein
VARARVRCARRAGAISTVGAGPRPGLLDLVCPRGQAPTP